MIATITIMDRINIFLSGLKPTDLKYFYDKLAEFENQYMFKPAYKLGRWDGKNRFMSKAGKTSIHYLNQILPDLKQLGYKIKIKDNRAVKNNVVDFIDENIFQKYGIILETHQVDGCNKLIDNVGGIVIAGTGAGKSLMTAALIKQYHDQSGYKSLVIVPTTDLVLQTAAAIKDVGISVGVYYSDKKDLKQDHLVSTWQALQNMPEIIALYDCIIVDECHGTKGKVLYNLLMNYGKDSGIIIGLTGTLPKDKADLMHIHYVLGNVVYVKPAHELIEEGWLANLRLEILVLQESFDKFWNEFVNEQPEEAKKITKKKFKESYFTDYPAETNYIKRNIKRINFISSFIQKCTKVTGNSFILVNGIDYGKRLSKTIPNSVFIYGDDDVDVRKQIFDQFKDNDNIIVISTFQLASTGLNIPRIFNLFFIDANKSFIKIIQSIGRGLRKASDKNKVYVWDLCSDLKYAKRHLSLRKSYYKEQHYKYKINDVEYEKLVDSEPEIVLY